MSSPMLESAKLRQVLDTKARTEAIRRVVPVTAWLAPLRSPRPRSRRVARRSDGGGVCGATGGVVTLEEARERGDIVLGPEEKPRRRVELRPRRAGAPQDVAEGGFGEPEASTDVAGGEGRFHVAPPKRRHSGEATLIQRYSVAI